MLSASKRIDPTAGTTVIVPSEPDRSRILLAGPWVGEFGWELMTWQAHIRALSSAFDKTVVIIRKGNEELYKDYASEIVYHNIHGAPNRWECSKKVYQPEPKLIEHYQQEGIVTLEVPHPIPDNTIRPPNYPQSFVLFGKKSKEKAFDVLVHVRQRLTSQDPSCNDTYHGQYRNWPLERWHHLADKLSKTKWKIASIGTTRQSAHLPGTTDLRDIPLSELVNVMASSRVIVGPSSGPMHLAALCGCPRLVWTFRGDESRYWHSWNPFKTPAIIITRGEFKASVEDVWAALTQYIDRGEVYCILAPGVRRLQSTQATRRLAGPHARPIEAKDPFPKRMPVRRLHSH